MVRCNLVIDMQMTSEKINIQDKTKNLAKNSQGIRCTNVCLWHNGVQNFMKSQVNFHNPTKIENVSRLGI